MQHYSDRYSDDTYEYRHVILPKGLLKLIPADYFQPDGQVLRLLTDSEWRGIGTPRSLPLPVGFATDFLRYGMKQIGIQQSLGWSHFECHAPEPHILLFRREKDYQAKYPNGKPQ
ncbi:BQ5605_C003g02479 [Microbotryum silenes-dioicae]|uniref:Cyclin-dependent kinases regulatory subunit n=1 Tax=Microbotryum silenes-dioicae TaxID=796604 RepID=A0A2X0MW84_9BASI|nr:BQ5605_C003g02479 [Microbotryum silenes-dioicae]